MPYAEGSFTNQAGFGLGERREALDEIGRAYDSGQIGFKAAVMLRDAVKQGSCSAVIFAVRVRQIDLAA